MTVPAEMIATTGTLFDGASARPHPVALRLGERLEIAGSGIREDWSLFDIRAGETAPPTMRIGRAGSPIRVEFTHPALAAALAARCPDLHADDGERGGVLRLVLWSVAAGVSILLVAIYGVPAAAGILAPLVPRSVEQRFGLAVEEQVAGLLGEPPLCAEPAARAVLDRLVARMTEGVALSGAPVVSMRRHKVANAWALPGGRVIVLSTILARARTPDEFAGILAHEFGHVAARDPTRSVITAGGVSFLLSLVLGDLTGSTLIVGVGQAAISAGYSREAEHAADAYGVAMLARAGGDGSALAAILERIDAEADEGSNTAFLRSHPYTKERAARIRLLAGETKPARPMLADDEWRTLQRICADASPASESAQPKPREP